MGYELLHQLLQHVFSLDRLVLLADGSTRFPFAVGTDTAQAEGDGDVLLLLDGIRLKVNGVLVRILLRAECPEVTIRPMERRSLWRAC